jgi:hypothetical protein
MVLIRPRITDYYEISIPQSQIDFAIPFFDEDLPLYVDPFLLWKSPSQQDQALHTSMINSFNHLNFLTHHGREEEAREILMIASECDEVGLGHSMKRKGKRIGENKANEILSLFKEIPEYSKHGFIHFEEIQLYIKDISKDRISDFACNFIKSFLIDFTIQSSEELGIHLNETIIPSLYDYRKNNFVRDQSVRLPVHPDSNEPIIFVPKRWLRFNPWLNFDEYFRDYCPRDDIFNQKETEDPVKVLRYNREHYGIV